jgi:hypothetical protein
VGLHLQASLGKDVMGNDDAEQNPVKPWAKAIMPVELIIQATSAGTAGAKESGASAGNQRPAPVIKG